MLLPFPLIYSHGYDLHIGEHIFPSQKYGLIHDRLLSSHLADLDDFLTPEPIPVEDLLLVHDAEWIEKLRTRTLSLAEAMKLEIPFSERTWEAFRLSTGGSLLAAREALSNRIAVNLGGGFHHAFAGHGEGFCAVNDFAVAIRRMQRDGAIRTAMVIDCDVHQGNGTAAIFAGDPTVFTMSIHQLNNYPEVKPPSNVDIHLQNDTGDAEYIQKLSDAAETAVAQFRPDLLFYVAGADPYMEDQLGGLLLTMDGLRKRDRLIFDLALKSRIPVATVLAGGYAFKTDDTVTIHCNTVRAACAAFDAAL
jgi:acetoin utilization deacetylase AcuC-like enzyme